jgi:hypothetical protein
LVPPAPNTHPTPPHLLVGHRRLVSKQRVDGKVAGIVLSQPLIVSGSRLGAATTSSSSLAVATLLHGVAVLCCCCSCCCCRCCSSLEPAAAAAAALLLVLLPVAAAIDVLVLLLLLLLVVIAAKQSLHVWVCWLVVLRVAVEAAALELRLCSGARGWCDCDWG